MASGGRGWHPLSAERGSPAEGVNGTKLRLRIDHAREGQPLLSLARWTPRRGRTQTSGRPGPRRTVLLAEMLDGHMRSRARDRRAWGSSDLQGTPRDDVPAPWPFTERARRVVSRVAAKARVLAGYAPVHATSRRRRRLLGPSSSWGRDYIDFSVLPAWKLAFPSALVAFLPPSPCSQHFHLRVSPCAAPLTIAGTPAALGCFHLRVTGPTLGCARFTRAFHSP